MPTKYLVFAREGLGLRDHQLAKKVLKQRGFSHLPHRLISKQRRTFAKSMRSDSTRAENLLWQALRGKKLRGMKFKRQVPIDNYIVDFVCFDQKFIIEVDGSQHAESDSDRQRDAHFEQLGFRTLRFWNNDIETNLDGVCKHILSICVAQN